MTENAEENYHRLCAAMDSLWRLGIIALHRVGSEKGEGIQACEKIYLDRGGAESGYLGFCFYRHNDATRAKQTGVLELTCGDFHNKNLVTRKIQDVVRTCLHAAGITAPAKRTGINRVALRSFEFDLQDPTPKPPPYVEPNPPAELIAATTAVPARSAPLARRRQSFDSAGVGTLKNLRDMALGIGAPMRIPNAPGTTPLSKSHTGPTRKPPERRLLRPRMTAGSLIATGLGLLVVATLTVILLQDIPGNKIAGCAAAFVGLLALGRGTWLINQVQQRRAVRRAVADAASSSRASRDRS